MKKYIFLGDIDSINLEIICKSFAPCKIPRVKTQKHQKKSTKPFDNKGTSTINTKVIKMAIW